LTEKPPYREVSSEYFYKFDGLRAKRQKTFVCAERPGVDLLGSNPRG